MKRFLLVASFCMTGLVGVFAQMSDLQVMQFVVQEQRAGTSQSQIVTKLMQRGVRIEQIRRIRQRYSNQISSRGLSAAADYGVSVYESRVRSSTESSDNASYESSNMTARSHTHVASDNSVDAGRTVKEVNPDNDANADYNKTVYRIDTDHNEDAQVQVFGRDIFNNRLLSFEPNMNLATPQNYVLGPGDQIYIDIYGASQKTEVATITPDGTVTIPAYGPIKVSGMTVSAAQSKIRRTLGSRYSSSEIRLTLGQTRTILVNVMGEVKTPGTYHLSAFASVFHALYMAGGINSIGTLRNIKLYRNGRLITVVDIYDYILNGKLTGDVRMQEGDVIIVSPYDCLVGISGKVKRPMFYEMRSTESVGTLIKYAGGFTGDAYKKSVRLVRKSGDRFSVHNIEEFNMNTFKVTDGDALNVDGVLNRYENMVEIKGAVFRPGKYQLGKDITSVRSLITAAEGVMEDAFTARGVMHRMRSDRSLEVIAVDVAGIMNGTVPDIPLVNEDVLFIPTQTDQISERTLTIEGEVMFPGTYPFAVNTTLEDLVMQAGGLTDAASTVKVDVSRRIVDSKSTTSAREIAKTYSFALKEGFVIDGQQGFVLEPYDIVQVRRSPGFQKPRTITVEGEVLFGGSFTLSFKNQRLSDAIKAAGGVTEDAYVKGARLERIMNEDEKARRDVLLQQIRASQSEKDSVSLRRLALASSYTVGIHLDKALANPGGDDDVVLREGDRLVVPEYNGTVKISGDVMFPNTVAYNDSKKNYKWYVNQAGGFGSRAKKSKSYIVYQNGTMAKVGPGVKVEPGCEIIVPTKPKRDMTAVTQWLSIGSSVTGLAAMIATIANVTRK